MRLKLRGERFLVDHVQIVSALCIELIRKFPFGAAAAVSRTGLPGWYPGQAKSYQSQQGAGVWIKSVNESYAVGCPANAITAAMTPSATEAMKSRFNVSRVSVGRW